MTDVLRLIGLYDNTKNIMTQSDCLSSNSPLAVHFQQLTTIFEDKRQNPNIVIAVYGVYNAGKSTLINALFGKEIAETGDIPLTRAITSYKHEAFEILDTPGVDAPKEHEQVTQEQLLKTDVIIFVVNPLGIAEEQKTLDVLMSLVQKGKKVFLVFNPKDALSQNDFLTLKNKILKRLQDLAYKYNVAQALTQIPIVRVNAKSALKGKLENKSALLANSGYPEFESQLFEFINAVSNKDVVKRLQTELSSFLQQAIECLNQQSQSNIVQHYNQLLSQVAQEKIDTQRILSRHIQSEKQTLSHQVYTWLSADTPNTQQLVEQWIQESSERFEQLLTNTLQQSIIDIDGQISVLQTQFPTLNLKHMAFDVLAPSDDLVDTPNHQQQTDNIKQLTDISKTAIKQIKSEHIVQGLTVVKQLLPSLMHGIGTKSMEKIATTVVGKAIPILGVVLSLGAALYDLNSEDKETARLRNEIQHQQDAKERRERQTKDISQNIAYQFGNALNTAATTATNEFFNNVSQKLQAISDEFGTKEQQNSHYIHELTTIEKQLT